MRKFEFSLGRMLDYRESVLEKEKNTLMQLFAGRNKLEDALAENAAQERELVETRRRTAEEGTTAAELQGMGFRLAAAHRREEALQQRLLELEGIINRQREIVTECSQQVKGMELLRENQKEEYDYAARQEESERVAELISSKIAREGHS